MFEVALTLCSAQLVLVLTCASAVLSLAGELYCMNENRSVAGVIRSAA